MTRSRKPSVEQSRAMSSPQLRAFRPSGPRSLEPERHRSSQLADPSVLAEPCQRCGVRADIGCRHQPAEGKAPVQVAEPPQPRQRQKDGGQGWAFHRSKQTQSLRGKAGNPTKREFNDLLPPGWRGK
jgi:hypothetical protein